MLPPFSNHNNQSDQNTSDTTREELDSESFGDSYDLNHYNHDKPNKKRKLKTLDDIVRKIAKQNGGCHQDDVSVEPIICMNNGSQESDTNGNHLQENDEIKIEVGKQ